jgi:hypothetical protein
LIFENCTKIKKRIILWMLLKLHVPMNTIELPQFKSHPECSVGVMTLEDARFLIAQGSLTIEGARYLFPRRAWDLLPKAQPRQIKAKRAA